MPPGITTGFQIVLLHTGKALLLSKARSRNYLWRVRDEELASEVRMLAGKGGRRRFHSETPHHFRNYRPRCKPTSGCV